MTRIHPYLLFLVVVTSSLVAIHGFQHPSPLPPPPAAASICSRRESINKAILGFSSIVATTAAATSSPAYAIQACPPGSKNCLRQTWTPPSSTSLADAISQLRSALNSYPQEGLEDGKVDGGGYTLISDSLTSSGGGGSIVLEYRSSGKGTFAKLFNGGKPFVDDLVIEQGGSNGGAFEFRSASRLGDSDFGVNGKRLGYIGGLLKEKGWSGVGIGN
ncbi:hypothetical protein ACHAWU_009549 [Discostella pseudostelligera]|uniref:Uncharacterized protein n=1 Tax=Discostella pseudostelligera TaxID=259834 RepID=A0ABD3M9Z6_9STRA